jgi:hypothetical protein
MTLEAAWKDLIEIGIGGASHLVEEAPLCLIYASLDDDRDPGITIRVSNSPTLPIPTFSSISLEIRNAVDSQYIYLAFFLKKKELQSIFVPICQDLSRTAASCLSGNLADVLLRRLDHWRAILDLAPVGIMPVNDLRGLLGEISVMNDLCTSTKLDVGIILKGWNGPLGFPHDFAILGTLLEVKSREPSRASVRISSLEQLQNPNSEPLLLAVVDLLRSDVAMPGFESATAFVDIARERFVFDMTLAAEFDLRTFAYGFRSNKVYDSLYFKAERVRYYQVTEEFPKLVPSSVPSGIVAASYDVSLEAVDGFIVTSVFVDVGHD